MPQYYDPDTGKPIEKVNAGGMTMHGGTTAPTPKYYDPDSGKPVNSPYEGVSSPPDNGDVNSIETPPPEKPGMIERFDKEFVAPQMAAPGETGTQHVMRAASNFGGGVIGAVTAPILHPINTLAGIGGMVTAPIEEMVKPGSSEFSEMGRSLGHGLKEHPEETIESGLGNLAGNAVLGAGMKAATPGVMRAVSAIRDAAIGDPNASALRGLRIGPGSGKALSTVRSVEGARPYLQGANSLEDLQSRLPAAKSEIWGPYQQTIDAIGDTPVKGPNGEPTTIGALENERKQISANLRTLKSNTPEAVQLAKQKGMSQSELLSREKAVQSALDPRLQEAGIDPQEIRKTFGQVSQVGGRISGKSTMAEKTQPYGFGKMTDIDLKSPKTWLGKPIEGMRDIVAGRPLWSGKPTDINLREAFRSGGDKPSFGKFDPNAKITSIPPSFMADPNWSPSESPAAFADVSPAPRPRQMFAPDQGLVSPSRPAAFADVMRKPKYRNPFLPKEQ